jgi:hexosaminidase
MIFPRMLALSEVVWGTSNPEKFADFQNRMIQHFAIFDKKGINYSKSIYQITTKVKPSISGNGILFELKSANNSNGIRYTTDGSSPTLSSTLYTNPIEITKGQTLKAALFENDTQKSTTIEQRFYWSNAVGKKITLVHPPHEKYNTGGAFTLVDGIIGNRSKFGRDWLGFSGKDFNATIDLGKPETINKVTISVLESQGSWIYFPKNIEVLLSSDGQNFESVAQLNSSQIKEVKGEVVLEVASKKAQYVKVIATNLGKIQEGNPGAGSEAWLFVDEIGVE